MTPRGDTHRATQAIVVGGWPLAACSPRRRVVRNIFHGRSGWVAHCGSVCPAGEHEASVVRDRAKAASTSEDISAQDANTGHFGSRSCASGAASAPQSAVLAHTFARTALPAPLSAAAGSAPLCHYHPGWFSFGKHLDMSSLASVSHSSAKTPPRRAGRGAAPFTTAAHLSGAHGRVRPASAFLGMLFSSHRSTRAAASRSRSSRISRGAARTSPSVVGSLITTLRNVVALFLWSHCAAACCA